MLMKHNTVKSRVYLKLNEELFLKFVFFSFFRFTSERNRFVNSFITTEIQRQSEDVIGASVIRRE